MAEANTVRPLMTILEDNNTGREGKLCFEPSEFTKDDFNIDEFLSKHLEATSLENLREDLGLYLKGLRNSMIDLINEDYGDFVNLSANLVGLDQLISMICGPLEALRDEVSNMQSSTEEKIAEIRELLRQNDEIEKVKRSLRHLKSVLETMEKLTDLLNRRLADESNLNTVDLERACLALIHLNFGVQNCSDHISETQRSEAKQLDQQVHQKLRAFFNNALAQAKRADSDDLERCLRIYIILGACEVAERVFRDDVVAPYMTDIISEQQLQNSPQGLAGIYTKILNFISLHMTDLLRLTQYSDKLSGFNFIVNSFWCEVEMRLEVYMNSIFAPGNSELFYAKYNCSKDFIAKIEALLASSNGEAVDYFRKHKQTKSFEARWNLPVYFQICFQEIAGEFEAQLEPLLDDRINAGPLAAFTATEKAIARCWSDGVYLPELFPKSYKLTVQIVMRLCRWLGDVLAYVESPEYKHKTAKFELLARLYIDTNRLKSALPKLKISIHMSVPENKATAAIVAKAINDSFEILSNALQEKLNSTQILLEKLLINVCGSTNIRQVNDLPRLYRKTNRDLPSRCSSYVEQMSRPLKAFASQYSGEIDIKIIKLILTNVCNAVTNEYLTAVTGVLISVQKTEESLRRLRNLKSGSQTQASPSTITDDHKIRLQLRVDVGTWQQDINQLGLAPEHVERLSDLSAVVEESIKPKEPNTEQSVE